MKKIQNFVYGLLFSVCTIMTPLCGEIVETNKIKDLIPYINQDSFVFLNVTGTLYAPSNALSDNQWRKYFSNLVNHVIDDSEVAEQLIDKIKKQIVTQIPKRNIEEITPRLIAHLQDKRVVVWGITQKLMATSYAENFGEITHNHLLSLNIQLEKTLQYFQIPQIPQEDFSFAHGILFTNKQPVGPALVSFLKHGRLPVNVVMVDNSINSLESAQEALESTGISFTGIRYGRADSKEDFDPTLGTIQFFAFINEGIILSDEEALKSMPVDKSIDYEALLTKYIKQAVDL